jgi:hypothetical protein
MGFVQMCINPTYKMQSDDQARSCEQEEYDPSRPNDYEQMLSRKKRIEKQLQTLINLQSAKQPSEQKSIDLNATADDVFNQRV